jgi:hypothetical protein
MLNVKGIDLENEDEDNLGGTKLRASSHVKNGKKKDKKCC